MLIKDIGDLKKEKSIWKVQESMQGFHFNQKLKTESITIFNVKILNMYFLLTLHVNTGSERRKKEKENRLSYAQKAFSSTQSAVPEHRKAEIG